MSNYVITFANGTIVDLPDESLSVANAAEKTLELCNQFIHMPYFRVGEEMYFTNQILCVGYKLSKLGSTTIASKKSATVFTFA